MRHNRDLLWKSLMEEVFADFLKFIFPTADEWFDLKGAMHFMDKEMPRLFQEINREKGVAHMDKLAFVCSGKGQNSWLIVHVEVQGETKAEDRPKFGERMFRYYYRIYEKFKLPIVSIVIFSGKDGSLMPDHFVCEYLDTSLQYKFHTLDIRNFKDEDLERDPNIFALVILIARQALLGAKNFNENLLKAKLKICKLLLQRDMIPPHKLKALIDFLNNYVRFTDEEMQEIYNLEIDSLTNKKAHMDMSAVVRLIRYQDGQKKGRAEEKKEIIESLIRETDHSVEKIARLTKAKVAFVKRIKMELEESKN